MKAYISGKMTGLSEEKIWDNFRKVEKFLVKTGAESVMNPAVTYAMMKFDAFSYEDWLHVDFAMLDACDAVFLLPNWETSMGAKREIAYAYKHKKLIFFPEYDEVIGWTTKCFRFDGKTYNSYIPNEKLAGEIALEVETYDVKKQTENLLNGFAKAVAVKKLQSEIEE
jgi:hypothetical protein